MKVLIVIVTCAIGIGLWFAGYAAGSARSIEKEVFRGD
jgi:hypothetical protein